ncbi:MAG: type II secretion system F family protein [Granulosicoccus sp.]|nr:type II secretion system F family protein [Granulosicoccus sp.]
MSLYTRRHSREFVRIRGSGNSMGLSLFHLSHLLRAGVGLKESLAEVCALESVRRMRIVWGNVAARVRSGQSFSASLGAWPGVFDAVLIAMIQCGEANGDLAGACDRCRQLQQSQATARSHLVTALLYPLFAMSALAGVVIFLFVSVIPSLHDFLVANQAFIAWHTRALIALSNWMRHYILSLLVGTFMLVTVIVALRRASPVLDGTIDGLLLRLPLAGSLIAESSLGRYATVCGLLYRSGVELDRALRLCEPLISNLALRRDLRLARNRVESGSSLAGALDGVKSLPGSFHRLLAAGESSGALGQAFQQAGDQCQQLARQRTDRIQRLLGPALLVLVGSNLLWIVISLLGPVYESAIATVVNS